ncbi:MAG: phosphoglycerate kinase [Desulfurococcales archaeon]|nr:phosphoglycerate kinase [Desulfurococcales archaeon]
MPFTCRGYTIASMGDLEARRKRVLLRVDLNSPIDPSTGEILDDSRIKEHASTIRVLLEMGASVAVMSHQGRPLSRDFTRLERHSVLLSKLVGVEVSYVDDVMGPEARRRIRALRPGDVLLLDNSRLHSEDVVEASPEVHASSIMVKTLAPLFDYYVNDAFSACHRSQASIVGFPLALPSAAGRLLEREVGALERATSGPERPKVFILGGAKVGDAVKLVSRLHSTGVADEILTGGLVALAFMAAMGYSMPRAVERALGEAGANDEVISEARRIIGKGAPVRVPIDFLVSRDGRVEVEPARGLKGAPGDIGPSTLEYYTAKLRKARVAVLRGPMGIIEDERFRRGTVRLLSELLERGVYTVIGGGHSNLLLSLLPPRLTKKIGHRSLAGGAMLQYLSGEPMPCLEALSKSFQKYWKKRAS